MDPGGPCCCSHRDQSNYRESVKSKFEDATLLQNKELELQENMSQMEGFFASDQSDSMCCCRCYSYDIPKTFPKNPENPVRDIPKVIRETSPVAGSSTEKKEICPSFFQKVMENAKSILNMKCSAIHPSDTIDDQPTRETDETCMCDLSEQQWSSSPISKVTFGCSDIQPYSTSTIFLNEKESTTKNNDTADSYSQEVSNSFSCSLSCSCKKKSSLSTDTMSRSTKDKVSSTTSGSNKFFSTDTVSSKVTSVSVSTAQFAKSTSEKTTDNNTTDEISTNCCWVNPFPKPKADEQVNESTKKVTCNKSTCPAVIAVTKSSTTPNITIDRENNTSIVNHCTTGTCPSLKKVQIKSKIKDEDNQCAFVGSPILKTSDFKTGYTDSSSTPRKNSTPCCCSAGNKSIFSINDKDIKNAKTVEEFATKEKEIKGQIEDIQQREKTCENLYENLQKLMAKSNCCCTKKEKPNVQTEIEKISQELKLENKILKTEIMEMKLELKHCLEKIEGPMKQKLETEKSKCIKLEQELSSASQNMLMNHDNHMREMNSLKLQLCVACSNITELNSINKRLKDEMASLDCMCTKLEDDLMKQKLSEAETIKRLSKRNQDLEVSCTPARENSPKRQSEHISEAFKCDSNLHVIARKLSKTLKDSAPCQECAKLPAELAGAAKCIKDLTDMVESRKVEIGQKLSESIEDKKDGSSQSPPQTEDGSCQCVGLRDMGAGESRPGVDFKGGPTKCQMDEADKTKDDAENDQLQTTKSSYHSAQGDPAISGKVPCVTPCGDNAPCARVVIPCRKRLEAAARDKISPVTQPIKAREFLPCTKPCGEGAPCQTKGRPCSISEKTSVKIIEDEKLISAISMDDDANIPCSLPCDDTAPCARIGRPCMKGEKRPEDTEVKSQLEEPAESLEVGESIKEGSIAPVTTDQRADVSEKGSKVIDSEKTADVSEKGDILIVSSKEAISQIESEVKKTAPSSTEKISSTSRDARDTVNAITASIIRKVPMDSKQDTTESKKSLSQKPIAGEKTGSKIGEPQDVIIEEEETIGVSSLDGGDIPSTEREEGVVDTIPKKDSEIEPTTQIVSLKGTPAASITPSIQKASSKTIEEISPLEDSKIEPTAKSVSSKGSPLKSVTPSVQKASSKTIEEGIPTDDLKIETTPKTASLKGTPVTSVTPSVQKPSSKTIEESFPTEDLAIEPTEKTVSSRGTPVTSVTPSIQKPSSKTIEESFPTEDLTIKPTEKTVSSRGTPVTSVIPSIQKPSSKTIEESFPTEDLTIKPTEKTVSSKGTPVTSVTPSVQKASSKTVKESFPQDALRISSKSTPSAQKPSSKRVSKEGVIAVPTSELPFDEEMTGAFPFDATTKVEVLEEPPADLLVTTTITASGTLEVITEAPGGIIETTLNYREDGTIEVITQIIEDVSEPSGKILASSSAISEELDERRRCSAEKKRPKDRKDSVRCSADVTAEFKEQRDKLLLESLAKDVSILSGDSEFTGLETTSEQHTKEFTISSSHPSVRADAAVKTSQIDRKDDFTESQKTEAAKQQTSFIESLGKSVATRDEVSEPQETESTKQQTSLVDTHSKSIGAGAGEETGTSTIPSTIRDQETGTPTVTDATTGERKASAGLEMTISEQSYVMVEADETKSKELADYTFIDSEGLKPITEKSSEERAQTTASHEGGPETTESKLSEAGKSKKSAEDLEKTGASHEGGLEITGSKLSEAGKSKESAEDLEKTGDAAAADAGSLADRLEAATSEKSRVSAEETAPAGDIVSVGDRPGVTDSKTSEAAEAEKISAGLPEGTDSTGGLKAIIEEPSQPTDEGEDATSKQGDTTVGEEIDERTVAPEIDETVDKSAQQALISQKRDCACQSSPPIEQSCQCCECKDIGVSTSQDSETITEENMVQSSLKSPVEPIPEEAEPETDSEFVTVPAEITQTSQVSDFAEAVTLSAGKVGGTTDEVSTIREDESNVAEGVTVQDEGTLKQKTLAEGDAPYKNIEDDEFATAHESLVSEATAPETMAESLTESKGSKRDDREPTTLKDDLHSDQVSTLIGQQNLDPFSQDTRLLNKDKSIQSESKGGIEKDDRSEGRPSSGSDTEHEKQDKKSKKSETSTKKSRSSEVPESVSVLSDKKGKTPSIEISDSKRPKKKRSSRLEKVECTCPGICQCVVCSPEAIAKRKRMTGSAEPPRGQTERLCCCGVSQVPQPQRQQYQGSMQPQMQLPQVYMQPNVPMQMQQIPLPQIQHPPGCHCITCCCSPCTPCPPQYGPPDTEAFLRSTNLSAAPALPKVRQRISIEDVFKRQENAQVEDCLKPYQRVSHPANCECVDCLCLPKIQTIAEMKEYPIIKDEKQIFQVKCSCINAINAKKYLAERSKIPIATNSSASPPKIKLSCTCVECKCTPCSDPKKGTKNNDPTTTTPPGNIKMTNSQLASLCDCPDCQCKVCFNKPPKKDTDAEKPETPGDKDQQENKIKPSNKNCCCKDECTCEVCPVEAQRLPTAASKMSKQPSTLSHPEDCDCIECACPNKVGDGGDAKDEKITKSDSAHSEECDCEECLCPNAPSKPDSDASHPEDCDCTVCVCPNSPGTDSKSKGDQSNLPTDCNCDVCNCPGKDGIKQAEPSGKPGMADCDCIDCQCTPCADPKKRKPETAKAITPCDCIDCQCQPCADPTKRKEKGDGQIDHPEGCNCQECKCKEEAEITGTASKISKTTSVPSKIPHPEDCDCPDCLCIEEIIQTESAAVGSTENRETHPPDCICDECLCATGEKHEKGCVCPECACMDCYYKKDTGIHAAGCKCGECLCTDCPQKADAQKGGEEKGAEGKIGCTCDVCLCTDCYHKRAKPLDYSECKCGTCYCTDCPHKKADAANILSTPIPPSNIPTLTAGCHCIDCLCDMCSDQSKIKKAVPDQPHGGNCTCLTCLCIDCKGKNVKDSGAAGEQPTAQHPPGERKPNCKCSNCVCTEGCFGESNIEPISEICHCSTCKCTDCLNKKLQDTQAAAPHPDDCKCEGCQCQGAKEGDATQSGGSVFTDPPPFEVPIKKPCDCKPCDCIICTEKEMAKKSQPSTEEAPPFEIPIRLPCTCKDCNCDDCNKVGPGARGDAVAKGTITQALISEPSNEEAPPFEPPIRRPCTCNKCDCEYCNKEGGKTRVLPAEIQVDTPTVVTIMTEKSIVSTRPQSAPEPSRPQSPIHCDCPTCTCPDISGVSKSTVQIAPSNVTPPADDIPELKENESINKKSSVKHPASCKCSPCTCSDENVQKPEVTDTSCGDTLIDKSASAKKVEEHPADCVCPTCNCAEEILNKVSLTDKSASEKKVDEPLMQSDKHATNCTCSTCKCADIIMNAAPSQSVKNSEKEIPGKKIKCDCPNCACIECPDTNIAKPKQEEKPVDNTIKQKKSNIPEMPNKEQHGPSCICPACCACPAKTEVIDVSKLDNETLMKKIQTDRKENCECREQIKEIRKALNKIKCSCTEAEMKAMKNKPLIKQASAFGQTMSGLKLALKNLQEKCKAKDQMIEVMTGELKMRTSSVTFDKVLNTAVGEVPDYDKANDVKSLERSNHEPSTNVLYAVNEEREIAATNVRPKSSDFDSKMTKAVETEKAHKNKKRSKGCKCGKPHKDKDCTSVDLTGFEIVDIRRITLDSIIVKWKSPRTNIVTGYDIFVNGVNKSKVMSGGRTSAMIHSLDLSSTIQITIYAVTKCRRCEPPAIAIYEINS